jgi:hypothetical protein
MKTFDHKTDFHCACDVPNYNWDTITSNKNVISIDGLAIWGNKTNPKYLVQMIYTKDWWDSIDNDNTKEYFCPECHMFPHRIIPNPDYKGD